MESTHVFSNYGMIKKEYRFAELLQNPKRETISSIKRLIRLKLANKKLLARIYKQLLKLKAFRRFLNSTYIINYLLVKRYYLTELFEILGEIFNLRLIILLIYHLLYIYKALFLMKMMLEWFPIRNWQAASPLKRFAWRSTRPWTTPLEKVVPSIFAWIIVLQLMPKGYLYLTKSVYFMDKLSFIPSFNFDELVEVIADSTNWHKSYNVRLHSAKITFKYLVKYLVTLKFIGDRRFDPLEYWFYPHLLDVY